MQRKTVGPFEDIARDKTITFGDTRKFRIVQYGAYNACGVIGIMHGVAVLDENRREVIADCIPTDKFDELTSMSWREFQAYVNQAPRLRMSI